MMSPDSSFTYLLYPKTLFRCLKPAMFSKAGLRPRQLYCFRVRGRGKSEPGLLTLQRSLTTVRKMEEI